MKTRTCCRELRQAKHFGLETLDYVIETREEYDEDFRRDYLGWHVHFHLASDEKRGIAKFCELLLKARPRAGVRAEVCVAADASRRELSKLARTDVRG